MARSKVTKADIDARLARGECANYRQNGCRGQNPCTIILGEPCAYFDRYVRPLLDYPEFSAKYQREATVTLALNPGAKVTRARRDANTTALPLDAPATPAKAAKTPPAAAKRTRKATPAPASAAAQALPLPVTPTRKARKATPEQPAVVAPAPVIVPPPVVKAPAAPPAPPAPTPAPVAAPPVRPAAAAPSGPALTLLSPQPAAAPAAKRAPAQKRTPAPAAAAMPQLDLGLMPAAPSTPRKR